MKNHKNIIQHFLNSAKQYPNNIALQEGNKSVTYQKFAKEVNQMANYYQSKGIEKGDRVLVFIPMSIDLYRSVLALFHIGATAVFLDEWVGKDRMEYCCELSRCKAFIGTWKLRLLACTSKPLRKLEVWLKPNAYKKHAANFDMVNTKSDDAALITFTTGSTGNPKAARRSHAFLEAQFNALKDKINPQAGDIAMPVLPIVLLCNLGVGATSVIASYPSKKPEKFKPELAIEQIQKFKINRITSSPYFVKRLAEYCLKNKIELNSLKQIFTGGAPVFHQEAKIYLEAFPKTNIEIVYGSTEAEPISGVKVQDLLAVKQNTEGLLVGNIYEKTALKIIPVSGEAMTHTTKLILDKISLPAGSIGEIIVAGDHVLKEYLHAPEAWRRNKIVAGETLWHRTGDSGFVDKDGNLFLTGRCKQLIEKPEGGYWSPFLFESILQQMPGISMGTLLKKGGDLIILAETKGQQNLNRLKTQIQDLLPEAISKIKFIKEIPRDPRHHSKIDYGKLKQMLR